MSSALFSPCARLGFCRLDFQVALVNNASWVTVRRPELKALAERWELRQDRSNHGGSASI